VRVEVAGGAATSFGLSNPLSAMRGPGLGVRLLLPADPPSADTELAVDASRLSGADLEGFDYTRVVSDRYERLRFVLAIRVHSRPHHQPRRIIRMGFGFELARSTVTTEYDDGAFGGDETETSHGRSGAAVAIFGVGGAIPAGRVGGNLELELCAGAGTGDAVAFAHKPSGPFFELRFVAALGADVW
jgi:hypothetical protein